MTRLDNPACAASLLAAGLLALAVSGCSSGPHVADAASTAPPSAPAASVSGWAGREDVGHAIELINQGDVAQARTMLVAVIKRQPNDQIAADLMKQIDGDPVALLGKASFPYTARQGDTLSSLAGRFLGNPIQFYALGRYNGLSFPAAIRPGQALRIPGELKVAKVRAPAPKAAVAAATPKTATSSVAAAAAPRPTAPEPDRAAKLRAAALEQLNRGAVDRAIVLLREADRMAPGNPLVQRDLDRALRIQRAVQSRG